MVYSSKGSLQFYRSRRRGVPSWLLWLLVFAAAGLLSYYQYVRVQDKKLEVYLSDVNSIIKEMNEEAASFISLKNKLTEQNAPTGINNLKIIAAKAEKSRRKALDYEPPRGLEKAHPLLTTAAGLRADAYSSFASTLESSLKDKDVNMMVDGLGTALKKLSISDASIRLFSDAVKSSGLINGNVYTSVTLADTEAYEKENLFFFAQNVAGIERLGELHGISIISLSTRPAKLRLIKNQALMVLPRADIMMATIEIYNHGNVEERNIEVKAILKVHGEEQKFTQVLKSIKPKERKAVSFNTLLPDSTPGVKNYLTFIAGPVPRETNTYNNTKEFKFVME